MSISLSTAMVARLVRNPEVRCGMVRPCIASADEWAATCGSNHADTGNDLSGDPILVEDRADKHMDPCPRKYGKYACQPEEFVLPDVGMSE